MRLRASPLLRTRLPQRRPFCIPTRAFGKPVYITTPIFYVNGSPHIGHLFSAVLADSLKRWHDLCGDHTHLVTGTDEHGVKVQEAAAREGQAVEAFCDGVSEQFKASFAAANIRHDDYLRTTQNRHLATVSTLWTALADKGFIYKGVHEGWYCKSDEAFIPETQLVKHSHEDGSEEWLTALGHPVEWVSEENYKFRLSAFQEPLLQWLEDPSSPPVHPPSRLKEAIGEVRAGLQDLSVSRLRSKVSWGIPVPGDEEHSVYVWLDALSVYLTGAGYPEKPQGDPMWPAAWQILGKDILRFHAVYWPAFLLAAGLPLPQRLLVHAHWTVDKRKMSKSLGNVVEPNALLAQYGVDAVRFFLLKEGGFVDDSNFSKENMVKALNADLADTLGNLLSRCCANSMLGKERIHPTQGELTGADLQLVELVDGLADSVAKHMLKPNISAALHEVMTVLYRTNGFFTENEPWKVKGTPRQGTIVYVCLEALRVVAILLQHVMPAAASSLLSSLGVPATQRQLQDARYDGTRGGHILDTVDPLFRKYKPPTSA